MKKIENIDDFFKPFLHIGKVENGIYFDLHLHTEASDGSLTPEKIANFIKDKTYLIAVTDHNEISGSKKLHDFGIKTVPGIELGCDDGFELLIYFKNFHDAEKFYTEEVLPNKHITRMARTTKNIFYYLKILENYDVFTSIPHISGLAQKNFIKNYDYIFSVVNEVDAIEIRNHGLSRKKNAIAKQIKNSYDKHGTYGSDAHTMREILNFYNYINKKKHTLGTFLNYINKVNLITNIGYKHLKYMIKNSL